MMRSCEQLVVNAGLGGVLPQKPSGDALLVADSNLSGTKGDLFVTRHYALSATVNARGDVQDRLTLTYHDPPEPVPANAALLVNTGGLYEDYVRVYLPPVGELRGPAGQRERSARAVGEPGGPRGGRRPPVGRLRPHPRRERNNDADLSLWRPICPGGAERGGQLPARVGAALYEDYVRVYLPPSANFEEMLVSQNGGPARSESPQDLGVEDGRPYVAFDLILDVNGTTALTFVYGGPLASVASNGTVTYQLAWERQINALTWPISVALQLPDSDNPHFQSNLSIDRNWQVSSG